MLCGISIQFYQLLHGFIMTGVFYKTANRGKTATTNEKFQTPLFDLL